MRPIVCALLAAAALAACDRSVPAAPAARAPAPDLRFRSTAPDVAAAGPFGVADAVVYRFDDLPVSSGGGEVYPANVRGLLRYPASGAGPFPVVLYLHGRHFTCYYGAAEFFSSGECPEIDGQVAEVRPVESFKGYDYMGAHLASHGYVVLSVDANDINDKDPRGGMRERMQLLLHHLDVFRDIDARGGHGLDFLKGRMDFTRVGLMGHSRGGQAVTQAVRFNRARQFTLPPDAPDFVRPHDIRAVFAVAPTDFDDVDAPDVAFATLLPYCDADVIPLSGARIYDASRLLPGDAGPKHQIVAMGANHNFYNSAWIDDERVMLPVQESNHRDDYCGRDAPNSGRDTADEQRRHGEFLVSSFFRLHLGGESAFADYWKGLAALPAAACPDGAARCDERIHLSFQMPASRRLLIEAAATSTALSANALGQPSRFDGFVESGRCEADSEGLGCPSEPTYAGAAQLYGSWRKEAAYRTELGALDASAFDTLTLRVGMPEDARRDGDFELILSDTAGGRAAVGAAQFYADVLTPPPGDSADPAGAKTVFNTVAIPLSAFAGVRRERLAAIELRFGARGAGGLQWTDLELQRRD